MDNLLLLLYFTVGKVKYCFFFFFFIYFHIFRIFTCCLVMMNIIDI